MAAPLGLKIGGNKGPCRPEKRRAKGRAQKRQRPMWPRHIKTDQRHTETAQHRLPFATDVEHPGVERDRDGKPGKDEVRRVIQRIAPPGRPHQRAVHHQLERCNRVFPDTKDHQRRQARRQQERDQRDQDHISPGRHLIHLKAPLASPVQAPYLTLGQSRPSSGPIRPGWFQQDHGTP